MNAFNAMNRYREVGDQTATQEEILMRLLEGAVGFMQEAIEAIKRKDVRVKGQKLMRTAAIIDELQAALDPSKAPDVAKNLTSLYSFIRLRLIQANLNIDIKAATDALRTIDRVRDMFKAAIEAHRNAA
jgi:flagellar secretion chaperone FliS